VHDRQGDRIGRASVQAKVSTVGGSGKDKHPTEPVKHKRYPYNPIESVNRP
jgi:hypothetical protein